MTTANRRRFLTTGALATAAGILRASADHHKGGGENRILLSHKCGMCGEGATLEEKFRILKELGYDGVELDSPGGQNKAEAKAASGKVGLPVHGVVDSIHWGTTLSDPSAEKRQQGLEGLLTAIRESDMVGGTSVLLVPAVVNKNATQQQAWDRSIEQIRKALAEIRFTGWATAEVGGGNRARCAEFLANMRKHLLGV